MTADSSDSIAWVTGWCRVGNGWGFQVLVRGANGLEERRVSSGDALPGLAPFAPRSESRSTPYRNVRLTIPDLSVLSPLVDCQEALSSAIPNGDLSRHAVYVAPGPDGPIFVPALLLLQELWCWTESAQEALLIPNSLALSVRLVKSSAGHVVEVGGPMAKLGVSDTSLRRVTWLAQSVDAQESWSSVLTSAHRGEIRLRLPHASLNAWVDGVQLESGVLAYALSAVHFEFTLWATSCQIKVGDRVRDCPPAPRPRKGTIRFM